MFSPSIFRAVAFVAAFVLIANSYAEDDLMIAPSDSCSDSLTEPVLSAVPFVLQSSGTESFVSIEQEKAFATYARLAKIYNSKLFSLAIFLEFSDKYYLLSKNIVIRKLSLIPDVTSKDQRDQIAMRIAMRLMMLMRDDFSVDDYVAFSNMAKMLNLTIDEFRETLKAWKAENNEDPKLEKLIQMLSYMLMYEGPVIIKRIQTSTDLDIWRHSFRIKRRMDYILNAVFHGRFRVRKLRNTLRNFHSQRLNDFISPVLSKSLHSGLSLEDLGLNTNMNSNALTTTSASLKLLAKPLQNELSSIRLIVESSTDVPLIKLRKIIKILDPKVRKINLEDFVGIIGEVLHKKDKESVLYHDIHVRMRDMFSKRHVLQGREDWTGSSTSLRVVAIELALLSLVPNLNAEQIDSLKEFLTNQMLKYLNQCSYKDAYVADIVDYFEFIVDTKLKVDSEEVDPNITEFISPPPETNKSGQI